MVGVEKSPDRKARAISRMCCRMRATPTESSTSRWSSMRPPLGSASKWCVDVYWSTPIASLPRSCMALNALSCAAVSLVRPVACAPSAAPTKQNMTALANDCFMTVS